jgi:hypothetical protein
MSIILKGLNESTHKKYDNNRTGFSRGPRDDERHDLDVQQPTKEEWALKINGKVWSKDGKTVTFTSKEKALKARQSLLAKRPELEVGLVTRNVTEGFTNNKSMITETRTYKLWESAGKKLYEAQLTQDQINQIFQYVEKIQTSGGSNRTMLGKGKDAAGAVGKAWEELKTKVQNSGPVKGFDAMYDKAAEQLKQATGGDQGVMQYVQKYRDFAKKHPVAQSLIYATLIAAAGISGAGVGGAAALGLFKMADKLLQGEKFSSAAYQGAKTGGMAYAAGQIGQAMKGGDTATTASTTTSTAPGITGDMSYDQAYNTYIQKFAQDPNNPSAMIVQQAKQFAATKAKVNESIELTESQIYLMIGKIVERQHKIDEGIMDTIKGAAGKAMNWAQTKGTNLTTKITADKLLQAWKKAGSPTDSLDVASIVQQTGVPSDTIKQVYGNMKIPFAGQPGAGANTERKIDIDPSSVSPGAPTNPGATATADATSTDTTAAPAGQASAAPEGSPVQQVQQLVQQLSPESKKRLIKKLRTELGIVSEEQLDELSNNKLSQYKTAAASDAGKADSEGDYNRANKRFSGIVKATKKQFANDTKKSNISQGMAEADEKPAEPFKTGYPRVNNPQILGTQNRAKSIYHPPSKPNVKKLDKPLPENLGNELKSKSLEALQQVKQQLEQQRMADLEQWEKDFKQNTVAKFTAREPNLRQRATSTSMVAMPGEKHSELKARLSQLDKAIEKQGILDKMVQRLDKKGLLTPNIEAGVDTSMLARDGARDNYVELNRKLDKALEYVKNRLLTNKAAYAKPKAIDEEQLDELSCWPGHHRVAGTKAGAPGSCEKNKTNESEHSESCPHCGGEMVNEELMNEKKDACYYKVKSRYKVWPSAYASGALVKCRNKGAKNWGNGGKKNEGSILEGINRADESLHDWFNKEKWVRMDTKGKIKGPCAREPGEGKPKCLPQSKAHSLGKKGRASAAQRKRREDPNPDRSGKAINVDTKKSKG